MHRSKLEVYEAMLEALARKPLKVDGIAYKVKMDCTGVRRYLEFLIKNGLVEERVSGDKNFYVITERGKAVFRALCFQKRLEKITRSIRAINEALEMLPALKSEEDERESEDE